MGEYDFGVLDWSINVLYLLFRIFLAAVLGFVIGYERRTRSKEAGIRTHSIVAMGAAIMMIISKYAFSDIGEADGARLAAQVVSGIGFLGAGIIFYRRDVVHGITTAAGIWATAGIGMAAGAGLYVTATFCTALIVVLQIVLHLPLKFLRGRVYVILKGQIVLESEDVICKMRELFNIKKFLKFKATTVDGVICAEVEFATDHFFNAEAIYKLVSEIRL
jgi:putative Mg2+ transporter-C (MgtC) family protein